MNPNALLWQIFGDENVPNEVLKEKFVVFADIDVGVYDIHPMSSVSEVASILCDYLSAFLQRVQCFGGRKRDGDGRGRSFQCLQNLDSVFVQQILTIQFTEDMESRFTEES